MSVRRRECFAAGNDLMVLKQGGVQYAGRCWTEDAPGEAGIMRMWRKASAKREYLLFSLHRASLPAAAVRSPSVCMVSNARLRMTLCCVGCGYDGQAGGRMPRVCAGRHPAHLSRLCVLRVAQ